MVITEEIKIKTKDNCDIVDITPHVAKAIANSGVPSGVATVFNVGSTAGITTIEYELGLINYDIETAFEKITQSPTLGCKGLTELKG